MSVQDATLFQQAYRAYSANNLTQAKLYCEEMLQRNRNSVEALDLLGRIAYAYGQLEEAESIMKRCASLRPREPLIHIVLGQIHATQGRYRESISRYDKALRIAPDHARAAAGKADVLEQKGDRDKARAVLEPWIESGRLSPEMSVVRTRLALHDRDFDAALTAAREGMDGAAGETLRHLHFLTGKALEGRGDYDEAIEAYRLANAVTPARFDGKRWAAHTDALIDAFSAERMARLPRASHGSELPVFVLGMPRSGSTLVETIIDAHPEAHAVGEFSAMQEIVNDVSLTIGSLAPYPDCVADLDQADVDKLAKIYLDRVQRRGGRKPKRLIDKYLINYRHLGLIAVLFPQARVLHTVRNPLDTCISCYGESLNPVPHPYAADLADLGFVYRDYQRLMTHWNRVLDIRSMTVAYEELVGDQERLSRELIDFCGLDWDDRCLRYYESGRTVTTLSYDQVNRPVYRTSVKRADRFAKHLDPLRKALEATTP